VTQADLYPHRLHRAVRRGLRRHHAVQVVQLAVEDAALAVLGLVAQDESEAVLLALLGLVAQGELGAVLLGGPRRYQAETEDETRYAARAVPGLAGALSFPDVRFEG